jgi:2-polyprenyl-3-methyl-5-hydroxy-6-metoxy-1,4-benzoquinol methylase
MHWAYSGLGAYASALEGGIHPKHRLMNYHKFFSDAVNPNDTVLDVGSGNGLVARDLAKIAKEVVGIDINNENIRTALSYCKGIQNVIFIHGDAINYEFRKSFDKIVLSNILEHINDRIVFLNKMKQLAPILLIRVPALNRDWITPYRKELGLEYRLDKTHHIEYTSEALQEELAKASLEIEHSSIQFGEIWVRVKAKSA